MGCVLKGLTRFGGSECDLVTWFLGWTRVQRALKDPAWQNHETWS